MTAMAKWVLVTVHVADTLSQLRCRVLMYQCYRLLQTEFQQCIETIEKSSTNYPQFSHNCLFSVSMVILVLTEVGKGLCGIHLVALCDGLASHPGGSRNTPSCFMLQKPG